MCCSDRRTLATLDGVLRGSDLPEAVDLDEYDAGEEGMAAGREPRYLEDIAVGHRFSTGSHVIDEAQITSFAEQFDPQPFHLDPESARGTFFNDLVASGWHTAAITMRLLVTSGIPLAGGIIGAGGSVKWPNPMRAGDVLSVHGEVTEVRPTRSRPDRGMVTIVAETRNQSGDVLQMLTATLIVPRRMPVGDRAEFANAASLA